MNDVSSKPVHAGQIPLNICWVDDEPENIRDWADLLRHRGETVELLQSGGEALRYIGADPFRPDVIMVDAYLRIGDMGGVALLAEIKKQWPHLRTVLITGQLDRFDKDFQQSSNLGRLEEVAYWFLPKPIVVRELNWILEHVRREKRLERTFSLDRLGPDAVKNILNALSDEVMVVDLEPGATKFQILWANEARKRIHGDLLDTRCYSQLARNGSKCETCVCEKADQSPERTASRYEHECARPGGSIYHVSERASIFHDAGRKRAVNVVRDEEMRYQLAALIPRLTSVQSEEELYQLVIDGLVKMGYHRVRLYRMIRRRDEHFLLLWAGHPAIEESGNGNETPFLIPVSGDRYLDETRNKNGLALHQAWELGVPPWAEEVELQPGDTWAESIIKRFNEEYLLLVVDNHGGEKPAGWEDKYFIGILSRALTPAFELLYDRRERKFLEELYSEIGRHEHPADALKAIVREFKRFLRADVCGIFMHDTHADALVRWYGLWGKSKDELELEFDEVYPLADPDQLTITGEKFLHTSGPTLLHWVKDNHSLHYQYCEQYESLLGDEIKNALYLPLIDQDRRLGILRVLNRRGERYGDLFSFTEAQCRSAGSALRQITPVIRDLLEWEKQKQQNRQLVAMGNINQALQESDDPLTVMKIISAEAISLLQARRCSVYSRATHAEAYDLYRQGAIPKEKLNERIYLRRSSTIREDRPGSPGQQPSFIQGGEGWIGRLEQATAVEICNQMANMELTNSPVPEGIPPPAHLMGILLKFRGGLDAGMIVVEDKLDSRGDVYQAGFSSEDGRLLQTLARQASLATERAYLLQSQGEALKRMGTLHSLTDVFQTEREQGKILYLFLTGLTIGTGLGYNRAVLFLKDASGRFLEGRMAIGPTTEEDALGIWNELKGSQFSFQHAMRQYDEHGYNHQSSLHLKINGLRFPLDSNREEAPASSFLKGVPLNVDLARQPTPVSSELIQALGCQAFALIPLKVRGSVLGVVYVDNRFNARPIQDEDINLLEIFCAKGAIALITYRSIEEALSTAHSLTSRLVAHRLTVESVTDIIRQPAPQIDRSLAMLQRLHGALKDTRDLFSELLANFRVDLQHPEPAGIENFIKDLTSEWSRLWPGITILTEIHYCITITTIWPRLKTVLSELAGNAAEALGGRGTITISSFAPLPGDHGLCYGLPAGVRLVVADNGNGIPSGSAERIFDPGYSTKGNNRGLGLAIARWTVQESLRGKLFLENEGPGARFVIVLPEKMQRR